jgi:hypothetical protein
MKNTINTLIKFINNQSEDNHVLYENTIKSLILDFFNNRDNNKIPSLKALNITNIEFKFSGGDIIEVVIT